MKWIIRFGDYLMSLSDRTRLAVVVGALVVMGGGGIYKLVRSINRLNEPLPAATPEQLLESTGKLFKPAGDSYGDYHRARLELDSLRKLPSPSNSLPR